MSSDESRRERITRNLRLVYGEVTSEAIPERFQELLRQLDDRKDDPDAGIGAEAPQPPKDRPKSSGEIVALDGEDT